MNIDKELEAIFDDPLLKMSEEEESLFDMTTWLSINYVRTFRTTNHCSPKYIKS